MSEPQARALLGDEMDTQDAEGTVVSSAPTAHVTRADLERAAAALTGEIMQRPPIFSALRKDGKRLYDVRAAETMPCTTPCAAPLASAACALPPPWR